MARKWNVGKSEWGNCQTKTGNGTMRNFDSHRVIRYPREERRFLVVNTEKVPNGVR